MNSVNAAEEAQVKPSIYCMRGANDLHAYPMTEAEFRRAVIAHSKDMGDGFFVNHGLVNGRLVSITQMRSSVFESFWQRLEK